MPAKVQALREDVIRKIAAGEVVERPASVVKELVENSLDAGSRRIALAIAEGGKSLIRVSDDGSGMSPQDAELALERHTTSKIIDVEDLERLDTFGFRGEALPSIAAVSKLELVTRPQGADAAVALLLSGGKLVSKKECGRALGTTLSVETLFFNVPARLKFLKSDATEKARILKTFEETALVHPEVGFELTSDGRKAFDLPARASLLERIADIWGGDFGEASLAPLALRHPNLQVDGWISNPDAHQATKDRQIFYVNRRPVQSRLLAHALYEAYRDCLPVGRHPAAVIAIALNPAHVDVNVHPSKREVRFHNEREIHQILIQEIRLKRAQGSQAPAIFKPVPPAPAAGADLRSNGGGKMEKTERLAEKREAYLPLPAAVFAAPAAPAAPQTPQAARAPETLPGLRPAPHILGQLHLLYILAEDNEGLRIVDQHAAQERILYEKFRKSLLQQGEVAAQPLLIPALWNVSSGQAELLRSYKPQLKKMGFALEDFGERTMRLTECPAGVRESDLQAVLDEILKSLDGPGLPSALVEEKVMHAACRAAVKASDRLSPAECAEILKGLAACDNPHTCPHGRPVSFALSRAELDKKFGRDY